MKVEIEIPVFWRPVEEDEDQELKRILGKEEDGKPLSEMETRNVMLYEVSSIQPYYDSVGKKWYACINSVTESFIVPMNYKEAVEFINAHKRIEECYVSQPS